MLLNAERARQIYESNEYFVSVESRSEKSWRLCILKNNLRLNTLDLILLVAKKDKTKSRNSMVVTFNKSILFDCGDSL